MEDVQLQRITHKVGATPVSEFLYGRDILANRITTWSQRAGTQPPDLHTFSYDAGDRLLSATVTNAGALVNTFAYTYDPAENRLSEQVGSSNYTATYNALNQISTTTAPGGSRTNEWDAKDRLVAVNAGNERTEFTYDGGSRMVSIRKLVGGSQASFRRFVWCDNRICEERDAAGVVTKRFFSQGMKVENGPATGNYFYTRDHLGSIRELTDASGNVRARYSYDPFGRRTRLEGDLEADFGFAGMFWATEAELARARFRTYDPELGRWLSRDPLRRAEQQEGPNLYAYVRNNPVNATDPLGLCCEKEFEELDRRISIAVQTCNAFREYADHECHQAFDYLAEGNIDPIGATGLCQEAQAKAEMRCKLLQSHAGVAALSLMECLQKGCGDPPCPQPIPCKKDPISGFSYCSVGKPEPKPRCSRTEKLGAYFGSFATGGGTANWCVK